MDINAIENKLKSSLSERRYAHSLAVANEATKLAKIHKISTKVAYLAGILHDSAKEIPIRLSLNLLKKHNVILDEVTMIENNLMHANVGAIVAKEEYGINDPKILDAIRYHTTAKRSMSTLLKIIFVADSTEPSRKFGSVNLVRKLSIRNLDEAALVILYETMSRLMTKKVLLHPNTLHARNYLIIKNYNLKKENLT